MAAPARGVVLQGSERSVAGLGRAFADARAGGDDLSAVFYNPAATSQGRDLVLPSMPLASNPKVVVELRPRTGMCWTSRLQHPSANTAAKYKSTAE